MIDKNTYKYLSDNLGEIYSSSIKQLDISNNIEETLIRNNVSSLNQNKSMLISEIRYAKSIIESRYILDSKMRRFVENLQRHIEINYGNINSFLKNNNIKVSKEFAELSNITGFIIDESNISYG